MSGSSGANNAANVHIQFPAFTSLHLNPALRLPPVSGNVQQS